MSVVFEKPKALTDAVLHYCPGCTHGIVHRLVAEVMDELGIEGDTVGIASVGCTYNSYDYFNCDMIEAAHGRAPAIATGVKRADPENHIVFTMTIKNIATTLIVSTGICCAEDSLSFQLFRTLAQETDGNLAFSNPAMLARV